MFNFNWKKNFTVYLHLFIYLFFFLLNTRVFSATASYRPYDDFSPGPRHQGSGGTGTSYPNSLAAVFYNPAYFGKLKSSYFTLTPDVQASYSQIVKGEKLKVLTLPLWGVNLPYNDNLGFAFAVISPYQRRFPGGENFVYYYYANGGGYKINKNFYIGLTMGPAMGLQQSKYKAFSWASTMGMWYLSDAKGKFTAGISFFFGGQLKYSPFAGGQDVIEKPPSRMQAGISYLLNSKTRIKTEFHITDWATSLYRVKQDKNFKTITPSFQTGFQDDTHIHIAADFKLPAYLDAWFSTGVKTASHYDINGQNEKQVLWSIGFGALAGGKSKSRKSKKNRSSYLFEDRLKIDISLEDSFLPSLFFPDNNKVEKVQLSLEYKLYSWEEKKSKIKSKKNKKKSKSKPTTDKKKSQKQNKSIKKSTGLDLGIQNESPENVPKQGDLPAWENW